MFVCVFVIMLSYRGISYKYVSVVWYIIYILYIYVITFGFGKILLLICLVVAQNIAAASACQKTTAIAIASHRSGRPFTVYYVCQVVRTSQYFDLSKLCIVLLVETGVAMYNFVYLVNLIYLHFGCARADHVQLN